MFGAMSILDLISGSIAKPRTLQHKGEIVGKIGAVLASEVVVSDLETASRVCTCRGQESALRLTGPDVSQAKLEANRPAYNELDKHPISCIGNP